MSRIPEHFFLELSKRVHNKSFFISGGTGFFGKSTLDFFESLYEKYSVNYELHVLSRSPQQFLDNFPRYKGHHFIEFHTGDISNFKFPHIKCENILHFATPASVQLNNENPNLMSDIINRGTARILEFALTTGATNFLHTSSGAVYGQNTSNTFTEDQALETSDSAYALGKIQAEKTVRDFCLKNLIACKTARCFAFVGPHLDPFASFAIGNFIRDAIANKDITLKGDGSSSRSYLYSEDLVVWLLTLLFNGESGSLYNVGSDKELSILELAHTVKQTLNPKININVLGGQNLAGQTTRYIPSISKAQKDFQLDVWTPLKEAIQNTAEYYKKHLVF